MLFFLRAAGFTKHEVAVSVNIERPGLRFIPAGGGLEDGWGFRGWVGVGFMLAQRSAGTLNTVKSTPSPTVLHRCSV